MKIFEITEGIDEGVAWRRKGGRVVRKYRCTSGVRKGRTVSDPKKCHAPVNVAKSMKFKATKAAKGYSMKGKSKRTKKHNPASSRARKMNKRRK